MASVECVGNLINECYLHNSLPEFTSDERIEKNSLPKRIVDGNMCLDEASYSHENNALLQRNIYF